ncbi:hypothetical protein B0H19DRAFT_1258388 [Mycena capillaripes]|nr:hypothetical protein B0H19DRAFT_1258388 [Mycena capillaripes]
MSRAFAALFVSPRRRRRGRTTPQRRWTQSCVSPSGVVLVRVAPRVSRALQAHRNAEKHPWSERRAPTFESSRSSAVDVHVERRADSGDVAGVRGVSPELEVVGAHARIAWRNSIARLGMQDAGSRPHRPAIMLSDDHDAFSPASPFRSPSPRSPSEMFAIASDIPQARDPRPGYTAKANAKGLVAVALAKWPPNRSRGLASHVSPCSPKPDGVEHSSAGSSEPQIAYGPPRSHSRSHRAAALALALALVPAPLLSLPLLSSPSQAATVPPATSPTTKSRQHQHQPHQTSPLTHPPSGASRGGWVHYTRSRPRRTSVSQTRPRRRKEILDTVIFIFVPIKTIPTAPPASFLPAPTRPNPQGNPSLPNNGRHPLQRHAPPFVGGGGDNSSNKTSLKLRLDLNLEVEVRVKARVHGDVTLSLLRDINF